MHAPISRRAASILSGACLCAAVVAFIIALQRSRAAPPPQDAGHPSDVKKLQEECISTLKQAQTIATELYGRGVGTLEDVNRCNRLLIEAELESAQSAKVRIGILQVALASAKRAEALAENRHKAGMSSPLEPLEAKAYRLRTEIELTKEAARK